MHILIAALHRPSKPTGVCRHAANLASCLADLSEVSRVTLVTGAWQRHYFETAFSLSSPKINIVGINIENDSVSRNLWFLFGLPALVNQISPGIVHLSFPLPFLRSRFTCPVVTTIHDLYPFEYPENFGRAQAILNRLFLRWCIAQSDGLICVSRETLKRLQFFFPSIHFQKRVDVIYNYVDFSHVVPQQSKLFKGKAKVPFLLSIAQHRKNKNLDLIIQAYAGLLYDGKLKDTANLVLVGSPGPETKELQQQIEKLQLHSRVHLLSKLDDSELCWLYQHCNVYVVASSTEGFCLPLAEALSFNCRAVCSDIPILREVAGPDCVYFDLQGDKVANLIQAIVKTLNQPPSSSVSDQLRFAKSTIANQYFKFYTEISNRSSESLVWKGEQ